MWLFHSVALEDARQPRGHALPAARLLLRGVAASAEPDADGMVTAVPEDVRFEPFDSLFEQRVFNRLFDRGYSVIPQFPAEC